MNNRNNRLITAEGYAAIEREVTQLEGEGRREIAERIKIARDWGDISENAEYDAAKNEQALLEGRIAKLRDRLTNAVVVKATAKSKTVVAVGSKVTFDDGKAEQTVLIVGHGEADLAAGRISAVSPIGSALMGRRKGDKAQVQTPRGKAKKLTVVTVG
jgi:transcription elongation factor GreA